MLLLARYRVIVSHVGRFLLLNVNVVGSLFVQLDPYSKLFGPGKESGTLDLTEVSGSPIQVSWCYVPAPACLTVEGKPIDPLCLID